MHIAQSTQLIPVKTADAMWPFHKTKITAFKMGVN